VGGREAHLSSKRSFARQDGMPPRWRIRALFKRHADHYQLTGHDLQPRFEVFTILAPNVLR
jgi:hypothetical protein